MHPQPQTLGDHPPQRRLPAPAYPRKSQINHNQRDIFEAEATRSVR